MTKYNVRREFIDKGIKNNSHHCMIVLTVRDGHPERIHIQADVQTIRWSNSADRTREYHKTPPIVVARLIAFDAAKRVRPFSFTLDSKTLWKRVGMRPRTEQDTRRETTDTESTPTKHQPKLIPGLDADPKLLAKFGSAYRHYGARLMTINQQ